MPSKFELSAAYARLALQSGVAAPDELLRGANITTQMLAVPGAKVVRWRSYREIAITDGRGTSTALLTPFAVASGPSTTVRQSVDLLRGVPGRSSAREDRVLMALWRLVAGESGIRRISSFDPSRLRSQVAGEVPDFEPAGVLDHKLVRRTDRYTQLAMVAKAKDIG